MRVSHPLVGILNDAELVAISARARGEAPTLRIPHAVWDEIARLVDTRFGPVKLLSMCMLPQPMLTDRTGRERTVIETPETAHYEAVYATLRWITTELDADAPRTTTQTV